MSVPFPGSRVPDPRNRVRQAETDAPETLPTSRYGENHGSADGRRVLASFSKPFARGPGWDMVRLEVRGCRSSVKGSSAAATLF